MDEETEKVLVNMRLEHTVHSFRTQIQIEALKAVIFELLEKLGGNRENNEKLILHYEESFLFQKLAEVEDDDPALAAQLNKLLKRPEDESPDVSGT